MTETRVALAISEANVKQYSQVMGKGLHTAIKKSNVKHDKT